MVPIPELFFDFIEVMNILLSLFEHKSVSQMKGLF